MARSQLDSEERALAEVWSQCLGLSEVGVDVSFFELGGDSILSVRLLIRLRETLEVDLPLRAGFEAPTVAEMAEEVLGSLSEALAEEDLEEALAAVNGAFGDRLAAVRDQGAGARAQDVLRDRPLRS